MRDAEYDAVWVEDSDCFDVADTVIVLTSVREVVKDPVFDCDIVPLVVTDADRIIVYDRVCDNVAVVFRLAVKPLSVPDTL